MAKKNQHVVPLGNAWAVIGEGANRFTLIADNQRDAITVAKEIAKTNRSQLIIHTRDSKIRRTENYRDSTSPVK
jgi:hypothetical protein